MAVIPTEHAGSFPTTHAFVPTVVVPCSLGGGFVIDGQKNAWGSVRFLLGKVLARHTGRRSVRRSRGSTEACPAVTELLAAFLARSACLSFRTETSPPSVGLLVPRFPSHEGRLARGTGY